jgi:hypothetical protein
MNLITLIIPASLLDVKPNVFRCAAVSLGGMPVDRIFEGDLSASL